MDYHGIDLKLVNVKLFAGHDTKTGLNAEIVYNGVKILHVYDSAHGGCFEYRNLGKTDAQRDEFRKLEKELEDRLKALPETEHGWKHDLDWAVDMVLEYQEAEKSAKKNKMFNKGILYKEGKNQSYTHWGSKWTLTKMSKNPKGLTTIQVAYDQLKADGKEILNLERLKKIGVKI